MIQASVLVLLIVFILIAVRQVWSVKLHPEDNAFRRSMRSCSGADFTNAVESVNLSVLLF
ncbi:hypothetical protein BEH94_02080 [Candidatus Altiarchaeales archaeon WOR_SM1_SCG]|nr:hypothetical protein BEH94_02080 [Candidatus Altiarchaeales archaeon WOR_SM1_SCG]